MGLNAFKQRLTSRDIPGTLEDQLRQMAIAQRGSGEYQPVPLSGEGAPNSQLLTPHNREAIIRPREVAPQMPGDVVADPNASRQRAVSFDPQTGKPNEDFYRGKDDIEGLYSAEQNWQPHGAKRGFKNSLKTGAMYAAEAVRNNPDHPVEAALSGFGVGALGGTAAPNFKNRLTRQWNVNRIAPELQNKIALDTEKAKQDALRLKPAIQQASQDEREINNALSQYNRLESYDPDDPADAGLKAYFDSRKLSLPKKVKGSNVIANWSNGRLVLTDKTNADSRNTTVTDAGRTPNAAGLTPGQQAVTNRDTANRETREDQFNRRLKFQESMKSLDRAAAEKRARIMASAQDARLGDPEEYSAMADKLDDEAETATADGTRSGKETATRLRGLSNQNRVLASKARRAQSSESVPSQPQRKWAPTRAFLDLFKQKHNGRSPTQAEIDTYAAAAANQ